MQFIPLTRANVVSSILHFLEHVDAPADRILATIELPPWITEEQEVLIPATVTHRFLKAALRYTDIPNLGLTVGEAAIIDGLGLFGRIVRSGPTLAAALNSFSRCISMLTSSGPAWLRLRDDRVEFYKFATARFDPSDVGRQQMNHFCLGAMIGIVRLAAGPSWQPAEVHLQTDEAPELRDAESLASAHVQFRRAATMITIPLTLLDARLPPLSASETAMGLEEWELSGPARDFAGSTRQALETLFATGRFPNVSKAAEFVGMSTRTLQRHLRTAGVSYRTLVAESRFTTAAAVLEHTNARLLNLALDLGYSDHANFTRAFRQWAGCSPREYRSRKVHGPASMPARPIRTASESELVENCQAHSSSERIAK